MKKIYDRNKIKITNTLSALKLLQSGEYVYPLKKKSWNFKEKNTAQFTKHLLSTYYVQARCYKTIHKT